MDLFYNYWRVRKKPPLEICLHLLAVSLIASDCWRKKACVWGYLLLSVDARWVLELVFIYILPALILREPKVDTIRLSAAFRISFINGGQTVIRRGNHRKNNHWISSSALNLCYPRALLWPPINNNRKHTEVGGHLLNKGSLWITGSSLVYKFIRLYLLAPPCRLITEDYLIGADICLEEP